MILKLPCDTFIIDKNNECMTYKFMKVLSNLKYQYFLFVNVVIMSSIDSNNLKSSKIGVLEFIRS